MPSFEDPNRREARLEDLENRIVPPRGDQLAAFGEDIDGFRRYPWVARDVPPEMPMRDLHRINLRGRSARRHVVHLLAWEAQAREADKLAAYTAFYREIFAEMERLRELTRELLIMYQTLAEHPDIRGYAGPERVHRSIEDAIGVCTWMEASEFPRWFGRNAARPVALPTMGTFEQYLREVKDMYSCVKIAIRERLDLLRMGVAVDLLRLPQGF